LNSRDAPVRNADILVRIAALFPSLRSARRPASEVSRTDDGSASWSGETLCET
jgi:hypothetical protein